MAILGLVTAKEGVISQRSAEAAGLKYEVVSIILLPNKSVTPASDAGRLIHALSVKVGRDPPAKDVLTVWPSLISVHPAGKPDVPEKFSSANWALAEKIIAASAVNVSKIFFIFLFSIIGYKCF